MRPFAALPGEGLEAGRPERGHATGERTDPPALVVQPVFPFDRLVDHGCPDIADGFTREILCDGAHEAAAGPLVVRRAHERTQQTAPLKGKPPIVSVDQEQVLRRRSRDGAVSNTTLQRQNEPTGLALRYSLLEEREGLRRNRNYQKADRIRDDLRMRGITVFDMPGGAEWRSTDGRRGRMPGRGNDYGGGCGGGGG